MDKLINNLLFLAKTESANKLNISETFDLSEEVNLVSSMFESMAYEKEISIQYNIQDNIKFNGSKEDIKQILSVLIDNAIMHTKENGLGLSIAKSIVEQYNGKIEVNCKEGITTFKVIL